MPTPPRRFLRKLFVTHLNFTPTPRQTDEFERDLSRVSPSLMQAALLEVKAAGILKLTRPADARKVIFAVYNRKVSEQSRMFPVFHIFETAFRSLLAVEMEVEYGRMDWWRPVEADILAGRVPVRLTKVDGNRMTQDGHATLVHLIKTIQKRSGGSVRLARAMDGYDLFRMADLHHVQKLAVEHWSAVTRSLQISKPGTPTLLKGNFDNLFTKVRDARNEVYHHTSTRDLSRVVEIVEDLLDRIDMNLGFSLGAVQAATPKPLAFAVPMLARHHTY